MRLQEAIPVVCGLCGTIRLSGGDVLTSQILFSLANPFLAFAAWNSGAKPTALLFSVYEVFAIRGALLAAGGI
ncbi:MAG: hypothetical protein [Methanosarcina spindle-shaped virus 1]